MRKLSVQLVGVCVLSLVILVLGFRPVSAQTPFYKGKTIKFISWSTPGFGGDLDIRNVSRHLGNTSLETPVLSW